MYDHFLETLPVWQNHDQETTNQNACSYLKDFLAITFKIKTNMKLFFKNLHPYLNEVILLTRLHQKK